MVRLEALFDLNFTQAKAYLSGVSRPWEALDGIRDFVLAFGQTAGGAFVCRAPGVWVHERATVADSACLLPPCVVDADSVIRHGAFLRGGVLIGRGCVVGNSVELKNAILFDGVQVPHFNYVGDSILGHAAHFGAGAITSNVKGDRSCVAICDRGTRFDTGRKKCGAFVGDHAEIGCNAVLNPGTVVGRNATVYPLVSVRGVVPPDCILKDGGVLVQKR